MAVGRAFPHQPPFRGEVKNLGNMGNSGTSKRPLRWRARRSQRRGIRFSMSSAGRQARRAGERVKDTFTLQTRPDDARASTYTGGCSGFARSKAEQLGEKPRSRFRNAVNISEKWPDLVLGRS